MPPAPNNTSSPPHPHVFPNYETMSRAAVERLISCAKEVFSTHGPFSMALAGGHTPKRLYELLAGPYRRQMQWGRVHLFWGDERYVPHDDPASNYRVAYEALIQHVPIPPDHVHPIPTDIAPPSKAASTYESTLRTFFADRDTDQTFDVVLLGMGADGHTASIFPEDAPHESTESGLPWVKAITAPPRHTPRQRITLTLSALNNARDAIFLVSGEEKREASRAVLDATDATLPAAHIHPRGQVFWFTDKAAYEPQAT